MTKRKAPKQADPNARPEGDRYRNLTRRADGCIYYERVSNGRRIRFSTEEREWEAAVQTREAYERRKGIGRLGAPTPEAPRLRDFAPRYLREDTGHLAATTRRDRPYYLAEGGPLLRFLGDRRLDEISPALLREWWNVEIERTGERAPGAYGVDRAALLEHARRGAGLRAGRGAAGILADCRVPRADSTPGAD
ncbi:MAG: hypothetical protein M5U32_10825 [Myxococcota bacterium]|nr:hypothetical protein [Myxococcota bacterium]